MYFTALDDVDCLDRLDLSFAPSLVPFGRRSAPEQSQVLGRHRLLKYILNSLRNHERSPLLADTSTGHQQLVDRSSSCSCVHMLCF